jgi:hypothetical protein
MAIIPIIFFALVFGLGSFFGSSDSSMTQEATPELSAPPASSASVPGTSGGIALPPKVVKSMFDSRAPLPTCGTIAGDDRGEALWQCLQDAADEQADGGELVRIGTTPEGDQVTTYLRVSYGAMEIYTDNSQDRRRSEPAWTFQTCPVPDDVRSECTGS